MLELKVGLGIILLGMIMILVALVTLPPLGLEAPMITPVYIYTRYIILGLGVCLVGLLVCVDWLAKLPINFEEKVSKTERGSSTAST